MKNKNNPTATLEQFIEQSLACGNPYFSDSTMEFFGSQAHGSFYELDQDNPFRGYFITSEQDDNSHRTIWNGERRYTVRFAESPMSISQHSKFGEYSTYEEAEASLLQIIKNEVGV